MLVNLRNASDSRENCQMPRIIAQVMFLYPTYIQVFITREYEYLVGGGSCNRFPCGYQAPPGI